MHKRYLFKFADELDSSFLYEVCLALPYVFVIGRLGPVGLPVFVSQNEAVIPCRKIRGRFQSVARQAGHQMLGILADMLPSIHREFPTPFLSDALYLRLRRGRQVVSYARDFTVIDVGSDR